MLETTAPVKQQAHDLIENMTPPQVSALIELMKPLAGSPKPVLHRAPFCDELPTDSAEVRGNRTLAVKRPGEMPQKLAGPDLFPQDSDFWPAPRAGRRTVAAHPAD